MEVLKILVILSFVMPFISLIYFFFFYDENNERSRNIFALLVVLCAVTLLVLGIVGCIVSRNVPINIIN